MNGCREIDRLIAGGREAEFDAHRAACASCAALDKEIRAFVETAALLTEPPLPRTLRDSLHAIPAMTVSCAGAENLLALAVENELAAGDRARLDSHLSRCDACAEAASVLGVVRELETPSVPPFFAAKIAASTSPSRNRASNPARRRTGWRWFLGPRGAIAVAYAAAVAVMISGFNPAVLARKAGTARLEQDAKSGIQVARNTVLDRFGAFQERAFRSFEAFKGRVGGYSRAALSTAIALVMRNDTPHRPTRPRNEDGSGAWKLERMEIWTWRAACSPGGRA